MFPLYEAMHPRPDLVEVLLVIIGGYAIPVTMAFLFGVVDMALAIASGTAATEYGDDFLDWINKGSANNSVYHGVNKAGDAIYTGITRQTLVQRLYQHLASGKPFVRLEEVFTGLTRNQARAIEQYFIENGPNMLNKINSISPSSKYYDDAMEWARIFLGF